MSDDERAGQDGAGSSAQRKGPRFSWTPAYEATFFRSLCESVNLGLKDNHSFKQEAWDRAMQALQERHGAYPNKSHLINKSDNARKKFRLWRGLVEDPEFLYNPTTKIVTASDDAWRSHIEKEPLSRSLKGRPFEHEEFYEILFPDVIGSGGAPKRITKPRRKGPDALPGANDADTPGTAILDLLNGGGQGAAPQPAAGTMPAPPALPRSAAAPAASKAAAPSVTSAPASQQRPTSTAIPPRGSIASTSALTPPDEEAPTSRKRMGPNGAAHGHADKRRRGAAQNSYIDLSNANGPQQQQQAAQPGGSVPPAAAAAAGGRGGAQGSGENIALLADALAKQQAAAAPPRWPEQAMDIFFRDFADEDMDLQLKIAEKMLTDANKAAMFCKMPVHLRKHWIKRLREAHSRMGLGN